MAATNAGCRNSPRSSIGWALRCSTSDEPASSTTLPARAAAPGPQPALAALDQRGEQRAHPAGEQGHAGEVERPLLLRAGLRDQQPGDHREHQRGGEDQHVDVAPAVQPVQPGRRPGPTAIPAPTLAPHTPLAAARRGRRGTSRRSGPGWRRAPRHRRRPGAPGRARRPRRPGTAPPAPSPRRAPSPATKVRRRPKSSAIVPVDSSAAPSPMLIELSPRCARPAAPRSVAMLFSVASGAVRSPASPACRGRRPRGARELRGIARA